MLSLGRNPEDLLMVPAEKPTNPGEGYGKSAFGRSLGDISGMVCIFSAIAQGLQGSFVLVLACDLGK